MGTIETLRAVLRPTRLACALSFLACATASPATAAPSLSWSAPASLGAGGAVTAVSCASESLCVAVDTHGDAITTADPGASEPSWASDQIDPGGAPLQAVSCAPGGPCVAVDAHGNAFVNPESGSSTWSSASIDGTVALNGVSCPSASLCVAVDNAGTVLSTSSPLSGHWTGGSIDSEAALTAVSCGSSLMCVAVDAGGHVLASSDPTAGAASWHSRAIDITGLRAVSCASGGCVAVDGSGEALASTDAAAGSPTWSLTPIDTAGLNGVSCTSAGLCVGVDERGQALASENPGASAPEWSSASVLSGTLKGLSCLPGGLCLAVASGGVSSSSRPPAPRVMTLPAEAVTPTGALLAGDVAPEGAPLLSCTIEYGLSLPYSSAAPCSSLPAPAGGSAEAAAAVSGLEPNSTYHYRLIASSQSGTGTGSDETFTTPISTSVALVAPHPSITGTPASGQTLTCHAGTEAGATVTLTYVWLRDLIPIAGSIHSTYQVKGQDSGHHLQCQVTSTDGGGSATARSTFVTVPMGGVPASVGETSIGAATFSRGRLHVPVMCSSHANGSCQVYMRLSVRPATATGNRTVTIAYSHVQIAPGAGATVSFDLSAAGRRLLASRHRFTADLAVSGTVLGVIQAQLSRQVLQIAATGRAKRAALTAQAAVPPAPVHPPGQGRAAAASTLAATPYMGWDTYFALGGRYSEATILEEASQLITLGLQRRGYRYVWLDVGWWHGGREADGQIEVSRTQWPHGLAWLTSTLHAAGFKVGLYTDAGPNGCGGAGQGSYGHYQQDVDTFAAWGFDAVKVDFCGGFEYQLTPAAAYGAFHAAILANSSHRPMLLSICNFLLPEQQGEDEPALSGSAFNSYSFGPSVGNSWRTDTDVGTPGDVPFSDVLRNMDADAASPQAAGPGHWNDPDYLAPDQGMNGAQFRTQLSMWAMLAAPLMVSDDLRKIGRSSLEALQNTEVTAVDQDPAGVQGRLIAAGGNGEVWVKPLADGSRAVALLNRGSSPLEIRTSATSIGMPAAGSYRVRNLWHHSTSSTAGGIGAEVGADGTVLLRVSAGS